MGKTKYRVKQNSLNHYYIECKKGIFSRWKYYPIKELFGSLTTSNSIVLQTRDIDFDSIEQAQNIVYKINNKPSDDNIYYKTHIIRRIFVTNYVPHYVYVDLSTAYINVVSFWSENIEDIYRIIDGKD